MVDWEHHEPICEYIFEQIAHACCNNKAFLATTNAL